MFRNRQRVRIIDALSFSRLIRPTYGQFQPSTILLSVYVRKGGDNVTLAQHLGGGCPNRGIVVVAKFRSMDFVRVTHSTKTSDFVCGRDTTHSFVSYLRQALTKRRLFPSMQRGIAFKTYRVDLASQRLSVLHLIYRGLSCRRVTSRLRVDGQAIDFRVDGVLDGANRGDLVNLTIRTTSGNCTPSHRGWTIELIPVAISQGSPIRAIS